MSTNRGEARRGHRHTALVLGAGGVLGAAWMTGALPAVQERMGQPAADVDLIVGTSAGSVLAAALRCGVSIDELIAHQRGAPVGALAEVADLTSGPWPRPPRLRFGSPRLMVSAIMAPHRVHPGVHASAWLPIGRERHDALYAMVDLVHANASCLLAPHWVDQPTWIVAVDYDSGDRVVFGRPGAPQTRLADAVVASCSVPGWFAPVELGGRRYIDGGVRSATSLDLVAGQGVDEVWVLAPMASLTADLPWVPHVRLERRVRSLFTYMLMREVKALRASGVKVTVVTPGPEDLAAMGVNLMDPRRRRTVLDTSLRTSLSSLLTEAA